MKKKGIETKKKQENVTITSVHIGGLTSSLFKYLEEEKQKKSGIFLLGKINFEIIIDKELE